MRVQNTRKIRVVANNAVIFIKANKFYRDIKFQVDLPKRRRL